MIDNIVVIKTPDEADLIFLLYWFANITIIEAVGNAADTVKNPTIVSSLKIKLARKYIIKGITISFIADKI